MVIKHTKPCGLFEGRFSWVAHVYEVPILRKLTYFMMIIMASNILLTTLYFSTHWNFRLVVKNAFMLIIVTFGFLLNREVLNSLRMHFDMLKLKGQMWPLTDAGPEVLRQIKSEIRFLKISRILVTIFMLGTAVISMPISGDIRELFCIFYLIDDIEQRIWYRYFVLFTVVLKIYFSIILPNPLYMLLTVVGDTTYGLMILREKLRSIEKTFGIKDMWYEDGAYQKFVKMVLIRSIQEHLTIRRFQKLNTEIMERNFFIVFIVGVLILASFYFNVQMNMSDEVMMKSLSIILLCITIAYLFTRMGQQLKNESEELFRDLCACPWFLWNRSNKMIYLMFLIHAKEPLTVNSLGLVLDYTLLVRLSKTTMSILTALQKLTS